MRAIAQFTIINLCDVITSDIAPENPYIGMLWVNTATVPPETMVWDGLGWVVQNNLEELRVTVSTHTSRFGEFQTSIDGSPYIDINGNEPYFSEDEYTTSSFEYYADLDELGRCGTAYACVGKDIMPTEERGSIGQVKPSGWHTVKYDCVDGKYLYNRCHLIGYQLTGENANEKNLITGTRYLNVDGMLPFENMVADYVKETDNHALYRVTPIFKDDELVARGVLIEAKSVEDKGEGITFCVYCYNVQPDISIDYKNGESEYIAPAVDVKEESKEEESHFEQSEQSSKSENTDSHTYILNTNTKKFHYSDCSSAKKIKDSNREEFTGSRDDVINRGYEPCKNCNP